jgi:ribosomal protein S12 methylthiotransferase
VARREADALRRHQVDERIVQRRQLLVISQDTSAYGSDIKYLPDTWRDERYETRFLDLARGLGELGAWVRMHYVYPYPHVDKVLPLMAEGKVLPYLDIPFQHASPTVLKRMRRPAAAVDTLARIRRWREICPELAIRSTFIVGFPGETDAEFEVLLEWLEEAQLDRVGCFRYSPVDGARANDHGAPVPDELKEERWQRFMEVAARISAARLAARIGVIEEVLVDEADPAADVAWGRTCREAPEIDGRVIVVGGGLLRPGEIVEVEITGADDYDLEARLAN